MNAPLLPTEPTSLREYEEECFDEVGRLMWAIRCHAEIGERYATLHSPQMLALVLRDLRSCYLRALTLTREAADARS